MLFCLRCVAVFVCVSVVSATQFQERQLKSPVVGHMFTAKVLPFDAKDLQRSAIANEADMGSDADGCRHNSGMSEYDYFVVVDPHTYFAAQSVEWDVRTPQFKLPLSQEFRDWVRSKNGFNSEYVTDKSQAYKHYQQRARASGKELPAFEEWTIPQEWIPVEKKYRLAIESYKKRDARPAMLAKLALSASWALRVRLNLPIYDQRLSPGVNEVNGYVQRHIDEGEAFIREKWQKVYKDIMKKSLSDEAYYVAGSSYFGLVLRAGDLDECTSILEKMEKRLKETKGDLGTLVRGLIRGKRRLLREYTSFTRQSVNFFVQALGTESINRYAIPATVMAVAEGLRRIGNESAALDWYQTVARMSETQPRIREMIRNQGGVPSADSPLALHIGWDADNMIQMLKNKKVVHSGEIGGQHKNLLTAIAYDKLGTASYESTAWQPASGAALDETVDLIDQLGKWVLVYEQRQAGWPESLGMLWEKGAIMDWNAYNRFNCPVSGKKYLYEKPSASVSDRTVLIALPKAVPTNQGLRYGAFLHDMSIVWSEKPLKPNTVAP